MLDLYNSRELIELQWQSLYPRPKLPCKEDEYWGQSGPMRVHAESQRRYNRFYLRGIGIVRHQWQDLAVYVKDLSRMGVGFYSPMQLFPCDVVELQLPGKQTLRLQITRCLRLGERCFDCGTVYNLSSDRNEAMR